MTESYNELSKQAKDLVDKDPQKSYDIYSKLFRNFNEEFSSWDGFFIIKAARKIKKSDSALIYKVAKEFKDDNKVNNLYSWYCFDNFIKKKSNDEVLNCEIDIQKMLNICSQKDLKIDNSYPCPFTIAIFKLIDAHANNQFNSVKIKELLDKIDKSKLSIIENNISTKDRGKIELTSDLEKYYAYITKALLKLDHFEDCISFCNEALNTIKRFHHDNDLWFKMRIAECYKGLKEYEKSETILKKLLESRSGSNKWFLYRDLAEVYYEKGEYNKSYQYSVDAALIGNEPHFFDQSLPITSKVTFKLGRETEGEIYGEFIASIMTEQGWKIKPEHARIIEYFSIEIDKTDSVKSIHKKLKNIWLLEKYKGEERLTGRIKTIHSNGKSGFIESDSNVTYFFGKRNLIERIGSLDTILDAEVTFYEAKAEGKHNNADSIEIVKLIEKETNDLVGTKCIGKINKLVSFGLFVGDLENGKYGLVPTKNLPNDYLGLYNIGDKVTVQIININRKNELELKIIDE